MKLKKILCVVLAIALAAPLFTIFASADKKADAVKYNLPATGLAEMEIDWDNPVATDGNLKMYFVRYSGCAEETKYDADEVIVDRLTGIKNGIFIDEVEGIRPSGLIIGEFVIPANGIKPSLADKNLAAGTIITEMDGNDISSVADYVNMMSEKKLGDTVKATYVKLKADTKQTVSDKITDSDKPEKALFLLNYLKNNLKNTEVGLALTELKFANADEEATFKANKYKIANGAIVSKVNYSFEIKGEKGKTITVNDKKVEKYAVKDLAVTTKADFNGMYDDFTSQLEYYNRIQAANAGSTLTVSFDLYYSGYEEKTVTFTTGLQTDALFILDSQDSANPVLWRANIDETEINIADSSMIARWQNLMRSLVVVYADQLKSESATGTKVAYSSADAASCKTSYKISNGKLTYNVDFNKIKIKLSVEFGLSNGEFYAKILNDTISEYGTGENDRHVTDIELLPFFGATNSTRDGYLLVPDGSGMLINFAENVNSIYAKEYAFSVGGSDILDMDKYLKNLELLENTNLPVFGLANLTKKQAFVAYSADADAEASVIASPAGYAVDLYRTSMRFRYRYSIDIMSTNFSAGGYGGKTVTSTKVKNIAGKKYTTDVVSTKDHEVRYSFLTGDSANYSGMANNYRNYLVRNGVLVDNIGEQSDMPIAIEFFMATWESQILFNKIVKMTSFDDAREIITDLKDSGVNNIIAEFIGYEQGGYGNYPRNWPIEGQVGGSGGASGFGKFARENGVKTLLVTEPIRAKSDVGGYSNKNDIVFYGNTISVSDTLGKNYFLNASAVYKRIAAMAGNVADINFDGVSLNTLGNFVYQNFNKKTVAESKTQTMEKWDALLRELDNKNNMVSVEGAAIYALKYADLLTGIPTKSSEYHITYKSVPFVQMVVHGYICYTDEPINLFYDQNKQRLQMVEYGCIPYYEVTKEPTQTLKLADYNSLFSSEYAQWEEDIKEFYAECNTKLADVWDSAMVYHENNGSYAIVRYENGKSLYLNYTGSNLEIEGTSVGAYDFEVR